MDNNVKSNTNFWTEINKNNIHVPYYQRDYAQGRCDGGRIDNIREVFVYELYQAITKREKTCHLGLVFGSYDISKNSFIAVDGQQRLTTVFLLHWYVAWREGNLSDYEKTLKNFSWDTRSFSSQFVALLFNIKLSNNVIEAIKTNCNYFSIWENDPTVKGMLTMLNVIEKQYDKILEQYPKIKDGLSAKLFSNDCNIKYDILRLEKNSDEKTYLKMNSRGRSLTTFELFKSKFIDNYKPSFAAKFDTSWLDFMLAISNNENVDFADPDISYMNFINEYTFLILKSKDITDSDTYKEFIAAKLKGNQIDVPFVSFEKYHPAFAGNIDCFSNFFDWIIDNYEKIKGIDKELGFKSEKKEWEFFLDKIIKSHNPTFYHRAKFISLFKYANLTKYDLVNEKLYRKWNRVFRNLIENSDINASNFGDVCETVYKINNSDIYLYLYSGGELSTFNKEQVKEEKDKAKQILNENGNLRRYDDKYSWEDRIKEAESYAFFKGAIRFLFQDAEGSVTEDSWKDFDKKWEIAQNYFDKDGNGVTTQYKTDNVLLRTLISYFEKKEHFQAPYYDNSHWRNILLHKKLSFPVCCLLSKDIVRDFNNYSAFCKEDSKLALVQEQLVKTNLLENLPKDGYYIEDNLKFHVYYGHRETTDIYLGDTVHENHILAKLIDENESKSVISCNQRLKKTHFFFGRNINFKYNNNYFQWYGFPRDKNPNNENRMELDVYLMMENWEGYWPRENETPDKDTENGNYFCFKVTNVMMPNDFLSQLDSLISQQQADEKGVPCSNECVKKPINTQK